MRVLLPLLVGLGFFVTSSALAATAKSTYVAAYDRLLAEVAPGQKTVTMGDMIVPVEIVRAWRDRLAGLKPADGKSSSASAGNAPLWTGGNVIYKFDGSVSPEHRIHFLDAAAEWATFANLTFTAWTSQTNYILVKDDPGIFGGNSAVGMIGGEQPLNIGSTSWNRGTLLHEIGHALGLIHEHQRSDRDSFVTIRAAVLGDGNFILIPASTNNGAYDFLSVMHYARDTLAPMGVDNITPKPGFTQFIDIMGRSYLDRFLSRGDRDGMAAMYGAGPAQSLVVTNTKDSGPGSLRAALYRALDIVTDTPAATPTITFQIPLGALGGDGAFTIQPTDRLIGVGSRTTIDATTQTAFTGNTNPSGPEVVLNGSSVASPDSYGIGLWLPEQNCTVRGLVINGFSTRGIRISGSGHTIEGCYIGTNAAGAAAVPNAFAGIEINSGATANTIGGTTVAARNVISGNSAQGVYIRGAGTIGNFVRGNFLGLNAAGTGALANGFSGIEIGESASVNTVGGTAAGAGNVLSGNTYQGVYLNATSGNTVAGNRIGTNAAGDAAVANNGAGIQVAGASMANTIGGTTSAARNVISGNQSVGVLLGGSAGVSGNAVAGNFIGLKADGSGALANGTPAARAAGVYLYGGAANNTIGGTGAGAGNVLSGNTAQGVVLADTGTMGNVVAGNFIGTNPAGTAAIGNGTPASRQSGIGIFSGATANVIGGTAPGAGNLISGNTGQGIYIANSGTNFILGNWIGLNAAGSAALGNEWSGVDLGGGAQGNIVGGTSAAARNVISGNQLQGVVISGGGTTANIVAGNYIGTNPAGNAAIANGADGVAIFNAAANTIGGTAPGAGNVISGNADRNVLIIAANNNVVAGNFIGLNAAGSGGFAGGGPGVQIWGGSQGNTIGGTSGGRNFIAGNNGAGMTISDGTTSGNVVIGNSIGVSPGGAVVANSAEGIALWGGAHDNPIGGSSPGAANLISGNAYAGIAIYNASTGNRISGNAITGNGGLGIDLWADGVTGNDALDADTGPNNLQNFPVLTSAVLGTSTTVTGTLHSTPGTTFRVEFFASATSDPSNHGEAQNFVGARNDVMTDGAGNASVTTVLSAVVPAGYRVTATAISPGGDTSEFSANVIVTTTDTDGDGLPNSYETANSLSTALADAAIDTDGDGQSNLAEFFAGTDPRNPASVQRPPGLTVGGGGASLSLATNAGRTYRIEYANDLLAPTPWRPLADQVAGTGGALVFTDPGAVGIPRRFYRALIVP